MGDNYKRSNVKNTSYRLPDSVKNKLNLLADYYGTTRTETLKRLINEAYTAKREEIKEFKQLQDNEKS